MVKNNKTKSARDKKTVHRSVSFTEEDYAELERIAEQKYVSVAWVVREAVTKYLAEQMPLFAGQD